MTDLDFHVTIPEEHTEHLENLMEWLMLPFDPRLSLMALSEGPPSNSVITARATGEAIWEINRYLEYRGMAGILIPDENGRWNIAQTQHFLSFALKHFNWRDGAVLNTAFDDDPEAWHRIVADNLDLFRGSPGRPGIPEPAIRCTLEIPQEALEDVRRAMQRHGGYFDPRRAVTAINETFMDSNTAMGHHAPDLIRGINEFLENNQLEPRIPGNPGEWTLTELQGFLAFAVNQFRWEENTVLHAWWQEDGNSWEEIVQENPGIFQAGTGMAA